MTNLNFKPLFCGSNGSNFAIMMSVKVFVTAGDLHYGIDASVV